MLGVIIGVLIGFAIIYILFTVWDYICEVTPYNVDEDELISDPIFDEIKCPKCYGYKYEVCYVDPLFNRGKYARCESCGWTWDMDEDETLGMLESKGNVKL